MSKVKRGRELRLGPREDERSLGQSGYQLDIDSKSKRVHLKEVEYPKGLNRIKETRGAWVA